MADVITIAEIRNFITDSPNANLLIDNANEFGDSTITLAIDLAISTFNTMPPSSGYDVVTFPSKSVLLYGSLAKLFEGAAALAARNHLSYSDGGVTLPIEEKYPMYIQLASSFNQLFLKEATNLKIQMNLENGWGEVGSDYRRFPMF